MSRKVDLADPAFEPTGAELQELAARAFAGLKQTRERSLERVRTEVAERRRIVLDVLRACAAEPEQAP